MKHHCLKNKNLNNLINNLKNKNCNLNMKDITDSDQNDGERNCKMKDFKIKYLSEYHDLYLKSDTLLLADLFENFKKISLELYQLDLPRFLSAPGLVW